VFFVIFNCEARNCVEIAGDRQRQPANRNCQGCRASYELYSNYLFEHGIIIIGRGMRSV